MVSVQREARRHFLIGKTTALFNRSVFFGIQFTKKITRYGRIDFSYTRKKFPDYFDQFRLEFS